MRSPVRETERDDVVRSYALVAGGGTAGHLQPALAIAEALVARGHDRATIGFLGSARGQDAVTLAGRGFGVTLLPGRGIVRSFGPRDVVRNVRSVAELVTAAVRAIGEVGRARPRVVVAVGGYASLAGAVGALAHRVPLVLVNVDAVPGAANRLLGRFARACAVGWEGTPLPRAVVTGTPVRPGIAAVDRTPAGRAEARRRLRLPEDRAAVVAFGGSLGARRINGAVDGMAERWASRDDLAVYHIVGRRDWETYRTGADDVHGTAPESGPAAAPTAASAGGGGLALVRVAYEEHMAAVYAAADLVVCRAGAMTVAELAAAGVPAVLVPLPGAPGDHQTANARVLERVGAAVLVADHDCTPLGLAAIVEGLLADPGRLEAMGAAARSAGRPDAADAGARLVEESALPPEGHRPSGPDGRETS